MQRRWTLFLGWSQFGTFTRSCSQSENKKCSCAEKQLPQVPLRFDKSKPVSRGRNLMTFLFLTSNDSDWTSLNASTSEMGPICNVTRKHQKLWVDPSNKKPQKRRRSFTRVSQPGGSRGASLASGASAGNYVLELICKQHWGRLRGDTVTL